MKKRIAMLLALIMLVSLLAGCGNQSAAPAATEAPAQSEPAAEPAAPAEAETPAEPEAPAEPEQAEEPAGPITVIDGQGREVVLPNGYATRAAVANRYNLELIRACGLIDCVVGVDDSIIENHVYWPEFTEADSYGSGSELNFEAIAALEPDVFITIYADDATVDTLAKFDIPVVVVVGYNVDMNASIDIIDQVFGQPEKSQAIRDFFNELSGEIAARTENIPEGERKVAVWESIKEYAVANGKNDWGKMIERAGGINGFGDTYLGDASNVDAEAYIAVNPDFIFKMVAGTGLDLSGYTAPSAEDYTAATESYLARAGIGEVKAIQDGNLYFVTSFQCGGMGKLMGTAYLAKFMYPEQFADFDPDAAFTRWLEEFQNIAFSPDQNYRVGDHA